MWGLDCEEGWVLQNWCFWTVVLEKILESPLDCKGIQPVQPKGNQSWVFIGRTDVEAEAPILWPLDVKSWHLKRPWWWERLKAGGEGDDRGWDDWMASQTQWVNSGSWWWTERPGVLRFMGSQRVGHDWVTELNGTEVILMPKHQLKTSKLNLSLPIFCFVSIAILITQRWSKFQLMINGLVSLLFLVCEQSLSPWYRMSSPPPPSPTMVGQAQKETIQLL